MQVLKRHTTCHCRCIFRKVCFDITSIPKNFLQPNLNLSHIQIVTAIYPFSKDLTHQFPFEGMFKLCSIQKNCYKKSRCHYYNSVVDIVTRVQQHCRIHHEVSVSGSFFFFPDLYLSGRGTSYATL